MSPSPPGLCSAVQRKASARKEGGRDLLTALSHLPCPCKQPFPAVIRIQRFSLRATIVAVWFTAASEAPLTTTDFTPGKSSRNAQIRPSPTPASSSLVANPWMYSSSWLGQDHHETEREQLRTSLRSERVGCPRAVASFYTKLTSKVGVLMLSKQIMERPSSRSLPFTTPVISTSNPSGISSASKSPL